MFSCIILGQCFGKQPSASNGSPKQGLPSYFSGILSRVRQRKPSLQVTLQGVHSDQGSHTQSTIGGKMLLVPFQLIDDQFLLQYRIMIKDIIILLFVSLIFPQLSCSQSKIQIECDEK